METTKEVHIKKCSPKSYIASNLLSPSELFQTEKGHMGFKLIQLNYQILRKFNSVTTKPHRKEAAIVTLALQGNHSWLVNLINYSWYNLTANSTDGSQIKWCSIILEVISHIVTILKYLSRNLHSSKIYHGSLLGSGIRVTSRNFRTKSIDAMKGKARR